MKRIALLPVAALVLAGACADAPTAPPAPPKPSLGTEPPPQVTGRAILSPGDPLGEEALAASSSGVGTQECLVFPGCIVASYVINQLQKTEKTQFYPIGNTPLPAFVRQGLKKCLVPSGYPDDYIEVACDISGTSEGAIFVRQVGTGVYETDGKGLAYTVGTCEPGERIEGVLCKEGTATATTAILNQLDATGAKTWLCVSSQDDGDVVDPHAACNVVKEPFIVEIWFIRDSDGGVERIPTQGNLFFLGGACIPPFIPDGVSTAEGPPAECGDPFEPPPPPIITGTP